MLPRGGCVALLSSDKAKEKPKLPAAAIASSNKLKLKEMYLFVITKQTTMGVPLFDVVWFALCGVLSLRSLVESKLQTCILKY